MTGEEHFDFTKTKTYKKSYQKNVNGPDDSVSFVGSSPQGSANNADWPEPTPLPGGLLPVPELQDVMIPAPLRPWLVDIAERMQCSPSFPVVGSIVALASLIGRNVGIRPKLDFIQLGCVTNGIG